MLDSAALVKQPVRREVALPVRSHAAAGGIGGTGGKRAGTPWSDRSNRVCPVIGVFMEAWHEGLPPDERELLVPLIAKIVRSRATPRIEEARALVAADWLVRIYTPAWLDLAGLREQARQLYDLPRITEASQAFAMRAVLAQVSHFVNAEALHVDEQGWNKASDDCWASGWAAAYEAARLGAHDPAWISAAAAARAAAGLAARKKTHSFKRALQCSAAELVAKMVRVGSRQVIPGG